MKEINYAMFASNKPIREITYEILKDAIIAGDILPGERIVESVYAKRYNISRTPIREALRKLEQDGLVEYTVRKGVVVRSLEKEDIQEIYIIRKALERLAMEYAVQHVEEKNIEDLRAILRQTQKYIDAGDIVEAAKSSRQIHVYIYQLSGLKRLEEMIGSLDEYMDRFSFMSLSDSDRREQSSKEHEMLVNALRDKDLQRLTKISDEHLDRACGKCIEAYEKRRKQAARERAEQKKDKGA